MLCGPLSVPYVSRQSNGRSVQQPIAAAKLTDVHLVDLRTRGHSREAIGRSTARNGQRLRSGLGCGHVRDRDHLSMIVRCVRPVQERAGISKRSVAP